LRSLEFRFIEQGNGPI